MRHRLFDGKDDDVFLVTRDALKDLWCDGVFVGEQDDNDYYNSMTFEGKMVEDGQVPMSPR